MKKFIKNNQISIKDLMSHITMDMYTKQTMSSLFRCLLETVIESRFASLVLIKVSSIQNFQGLINRLKYSDAKVYVYSDNLHSENFNEIGLDASELQHDEFLIIIDDRFSACLYWDETTIEVFGLCQGFCSLSPYDSRQIADHLQTVAFHEELDKELSELKQDRRRNENFTMIIRKLVASLESHQRDLMCANKELKEFYDKTLQTEKLAAIGQLCSTIAHELRNPLSSVNMHARVITKSIEKLRANIQDPKVAESLVNAASSISNASLSLDRLLTELIDYSKPLTIERSDNDLKAAIEELINLVKPNFEAKKVKLSFSYSVDEEIKVIFDKIRLNQSILNVVKNALEISKDGDQVDISVEYNSNDNLVCINVKDQGSGISTDDKEKLFTPYFTTKREGTGLGLAQARKILEAHKGGLILVSTSPKGSIFGLTLPVE